MIESRVSSAVDAIIPVSSASTDTALLTTHKRVASSIAPTVDSAKRRPPVFAPTLSAPTESHSPDVVVNI